MAEFLSFLDFFRPFFNTPAKFSLVQTKQMFLRFSAQFHGQIVDPDIQEPHVYIVVQRLCANHLIPGKVFRYESIARADIKEPPCGKELLFNKLDESLLIKVAVMMAGGLSVLFVDLLPPGGFIPSFGAVIKQCGSALDFIGYSSWRTSKLSGNGS